MKRSPTGSQASLTPSACSRATASSSIAAWTWRRRSKVLSMSLATLACFHTERLTFKIRRRGETSAEGERDPVILTSLVPHFLHLVLTPFSPAAPPLVTPEAGRLRKTTMWVQRYSRASRREASCCSQRGQKKETLLPGHIEAPVLKRNRMEPQRFISPVWCGPPPLRPRHSAPPSSRPSPSTVDWHGTQWHPGHEGRPAAEDKRQQGDTLSIHLPAVFVNKTAEAPRDTVMLRQQKGSVVVCLPWKSYATTPINHITDRRQEDAAERDCLVFSDRALERSTPRADTGLNRGDFQKQKAGQGRSEAVALLQSRAVSIIHSGTSGFHRPAISEGPCIMHAPPRSSSEAVTTGAATALSITGAHAVCSSNPGVTRQTYGPGLITPAAIAPELLRAADNLPLEDNACMEASRTRREENENIKEEGSRFKWKMRKDKDEKG
ncbi:hypothetical protein EYF80_017015 [Liparis tanakae]|uniref:Uncharacterized protein n=1 Tax=Liparis tanakae TaxID=230148 RepID=A0A4Z2I4N4_9TELE|nr:hypothetical protein EYF80_017015 [Liparis tanakae]